MRTLVIAGLAVLLLVVGILAFPLLYDPTTVQNFLLRQVERQLGRTIEVGRAHLEVFPRIRLELSDVVIRDLDPAHVFFTARRLEIVLRAYSLLRQQVVGKRLIVDRPRLELRRDRDGVWNFLKAVEGDEHVEPNAPPAMGDPLALLLRVRETTVSDGAVTIIDEFRPDGTRTMDITSLNGHVMVGSKGQQAEVDVSGSIPYHATDSSASAFLVTGRVSQFESSVKLTLEEGEPGGIPALAFDGAVEVAKLKIRQFADFFGPRPVPERITGTADLKGQVTLSPGIVGYDVLLSKMSATVEGLSLTGHAHLSGLMAAQPTFSLTFSSSPVNLDELLTRFPVQWLPPQLQMALIERDIGGSVQVATATITGATEPEPRMSLTGEFQISRGRLLVGDNRTPIQNMSARVFVEPDRLRVMELSGMYGPMRIMAGKALVSPLETSPWLDLEVRGEMAAADLIATLGKTITVRAVAERFAEVTEVKGQAQVMLRIGGPVKEGDNLKIVRAEVTALDVWMRSPLLPERLVDLNGRFLYSKTGVEFDKLAGRIGRTQLELGGGISFGEPSVYQDFTLRTRGDVTQLMQLASVGVPPNMTWQGMATGTFILGGPLNAPRVKTVLDVRDTEFTAGDLMHKPLGTSAAVEFEGAWGRDQTLSVDRFDIVLPPFRLTTKGKIRLGPEPVIDASVVTGPVSIAGLPQGMTTGPLKDGILEVSLDVKGRGSDWRAWHMNGWVAVTDGLVMPKGVEHTIKDLYLRLKVVRTGAEIKRLAFKIKESDVRMTGTVRNWNRSPFFNVDIESALLDIDLLIPKGKRSPIRDFLEALAESSRVMGTASIDRGVYKNLSFTDLSLRLNIRNSILDVDRISGDTDDGTIAGRLVVYLPKEKNAELDITVRFSGMEVEKLLVMTGDESRLASGSLSANGNIRGNDGDPLGFIHSLDGKTDFVVENGRVKRGKIIPKIITILNLPTLLQGKVDLAKDGLPFDKIVGSFTLSNGVLTEDNLVIDSPVMKMSAAGNYDIPADHLDAVVVVSPFGSYSQLLKSIPLFGKIFKGEREGTALFEVKGTLQKPDVNYMPLRSFAKGLTGLAQLAFDMLKNTIMLPKEIVSPSDETPSTDGVRRGRQTSQDRPEPRLP